MPHSSIYKYPSAFQPIFVKTNCQTLTCTIINSISLGQIVCAVSSFVLCHSVDNATDLRYTLLWYWLSYRRQVIAAQTAFSASSLNENNICHNNNKLDATSIDSSWYNGGAIEYRRHGWERKRWGRHWER